MLTEKQLQSAKPKSKSYKLSDGHGLYVDVMPTGSKLWRYKYRRQAGKETRVSYGAYPVITIKQARELHWESRRQVAAGVSPTEQRRINKRELINTFGAAADSWFETRRKKGAAATLNKIEWLLGLVKPLLGNKPIKTIDGPDVLAALRKIEVGGRHETAHRAHQVCGQVFRHAMAEGFCKLDPSAGLYDALIKTKTTHRPALKKPEEIGGLLRKIDAFPGRPTTVAALQLLPLVFTRPGELRQAQWAEFDLDAGRWVVPAERMKMRKEHIVPLSKQAIKILQTLHTLTGRGLFIFPAQGKRTRPISENTINGALRRMGYDTQTQMCAHGFRVIASTQLNQMGYDADVIEAQLAHQDENQIRRIYNRADHIAERSKLMQYWADHLDGLRAGKHATERMTPKAKRSTRQATS